VLTRRLTQTLGAIGYQFGELLSRRGQIHPPLLTAREVEVLQSAADGYSGPEIAGRLSVTPATIASHMPHIYERLGVSNRGAAVAVAIRSGVIAQLHR
jgi:two-component system, NarL family, nitrate/nitrite response regulator NarL